MRGTAQVEQFGGKIGEASFDGLERCRGRIVDILDKG